MLKILHICSYYAGSSVYKNLVGKLALDHRIGRQTVLIPTRNISHGSCNEMREVGVKLIYMKVLNLFTRASMLLKQRRLKKKFQGIIEKDYSVLDSSLIHAHTLYSDGLLAHYINREYGLPYVITVRTTDASIFNRFYVHWERRIKAVLKDAKSIIFLSQKIRDRFVMKYPGLGEKSLLIPNGVDSFWIASACLKKESMKNSEIRGIYIGSINRNKNIKKTIQAFFSLNTEKSRKFKVIGGSYDDYLKVYGELDKSILKNITFEGYFDDKERVRAHLFNSDVLVMPSHMETFGLVYLEAISQCTPVVYNEGQGVDGLFEEGGVGYSCDGRDVSSIREAIDKTLRRYPTGLDFRARKVNPVAQFSWDCVADTMISKAYY